MTSRTLSHLLSYLRDLRRLVRDTLANDSLQTAIRDGFLRSSTKQPNSKQTIALASVEDSFYFGLFGHLITSIRTKCPVRAELFVLRSLNVGEGRSLLRFLNARCFVGRLTSIKWTRLYLSFADGIAYSSTSLRPIDDLVDFFKARASWRRLRSKSQVLAMEIDGIPVGDLVNDSYLRFKPAASLQIEDEYLWIVIWQARRDVRRAKRYFKAVRPKLLLTSYAAYVQLGIAVRVALIAGVKVFSFGNYQELSKQLSLRDWLHTKNTDRYALEFELLCDKEVRLAEADEALSARMAGVVDSATAYMQVSAYQESEQAVPDVTDAVIVFLHDFYDSPHCYYGLVFSDFWDWICVTIETLTDAGIAFYIKPHPNQIAMSGEALLDLRQRYPDARFVPSSITNKQLASAGMRCAVTVYGTVAHEMAYLGIPTIACARHPHISFGFCQTAGTREEYIRALREVKALEFDSARARDESLRFFHMHNRNLSQDDLVLRDATLHIRLQCALTGDSGDVVSAKLQRLGSFPAYWNLVDQFVAILANGPESTAQDIA